ncbi:lipopolysaccharide assembly protein LapB [Kangiella profundi]|uniref:Lipopolysaccharide assembly protein B n=1 Tax=Kangiella profundi TaxID=1561924 RepID=A0A2K9ADL4_9GAMM|nr:lipopolysaccharide assembly protein LapB [Kangiella profundi]AUD78486.1 lipopolysaccharide assembly protein LapB [Kangiella profundi]GGF08282.1 lipopolysaccharide assembly protein B [Kangiella profundi]
MNDWFLYGVLALLPIAAFSGYRLGRKQRKEQQSSNGSLSSNYIKGLNYLLNEQADKAVDTFIDLLTVDTDTVETHLALGNLFRKRGEVDRAIRLHQNLIARPQLKTEDRNTALYQLGLDYNAVGMYDRAVSLFNELLSDPEHKSESLHQLLNIYQLTKDWDQAAKIAEQLQSSLGEEQSKPLAHFYCELAEQKQIEGDTKAALANLKKALSINPDSVRASILQGDIYLQQSNFKQAIKAYQRILKQDIAFLPEALPKIAEAYNAQNDLKGYKQFLNESLQHDAGVSLLIELSKIIQKEKGDKAAALLIGEYLQDKPSLKGLHRLISLHIEHAQESAKPSLQLLDGIVEKLLQRKPRYECQNCGFHTKAIYWQCPSCKEWSSVKPIKGIEGE